MEQRKDWTIAEYIDELDRLHSLEESMDPAVFYQLNYYLQAEMEARFPVAERQKHSLKF